MSWQFGDLKLFGYDLLVVDPPWSFELYSEAGAEKSAQAQYQTMTLDAIKQLRIGDLARGDCLLMLWATGCMIPQCLEAMRAWGFVYKSEIVWLKTTRTGKLRWGPGYRVRTLHEPILLGTIGNPHHHAFPSAFYGLARQHSRKPEEFYSMIDACAPDLGFRADVFSRTNRRGWDAFGNETGKFEAAA